jgi:uncharacterized membrane protein
MRFAPKPWAGGLGFRQVVRTALLLFLVGAVPHVFAKSYSLDRVDVAARLETDGSLLIEETRTYTFSGSYAWADFRLPLDRVGTVSDFSLSEGSRVYSAGFDETPGSYVLEVDSGQMYVKWFYRANDETRSFKLRYRISDAVRVYADTAEFYFQFVGAINPQRIGRVSVVLALPERASFGPVRAWAHGPLWGTVEFRDTGRIGFDVAPLPERQMWEARVIFPREWVTVAGSSSPMLDQILAEEDAWARDANAERERVSENAEQARELNRLAGWGAPGLVAVGLFVVLLGYLKAGRAHPIAYYQETDMSVPQEPPAIVSYLYYGKQVHGAALGATLFDLARRGLLSIVPDVEPRKWWQSSARFTIQLNARERERQSAELATYETSLIDFLFDIVAGGNETLHSRELMKARGKMQKWFRTWKDEVKRTAGDYRLYDPASVRTAIAAGVFNALVLAAGIAMIIVAGPVGVIAIIGGAIALGLSFAILRYTPEVALKRKKLNAFRNYLKKYHHSAGEQMGDRIGKFLVYGLSLGIGAKALERLFESIPAAARATYVPWYIHSQGAASPAEFAQSMAAVVAATTSTVSSSAGAGGGASAGGGGGGGGGGGSAG